MTYMLITKNTALDTHFFLDFVSKLWEKEIDNQDLNNNPDFHLLDGLSINSIGIEDVKNLQEEMRFKPFKERVQIAVILDAKKLTVQAQNAFLKTLEDSSDSTVYILVVSNEKELLPTIVSRSKKVYDSKSIGKSSSKSSSEFIFESNNLIEAFNSIEKISKEKIESITYLEEYLDALQNLLRKSIKEGIHSREITDKISLVNTTKGQILANGNRRLILENLYLQINEISRQTT